VLDGAVDFAQSAAYADFFLGNDSFHFGASFFTEREQMVTKNSKLNISRTLTNGFYEHLPSEVSIFVTSVLFR
jgi:hypothetical protein